MGNSRNLKSLKQQNLLDPKFQMKRHRMQLLEYDGYKRLTDVMETTVPLHGKCNFPTIEVTPRDLVQMVRTRLFRENINVKNIRLNGSAATHVLSQTENHTYKDLDLIFAVDLNQYQEEDEKSTSKSVPNLVVPPSYAESDDAGASFKRQRSISEDGCYMDASNVLSRSKKSELSLDNNLKRPNDLLLRESVKDFLTLDRVSRKSKEVNPPVLCGCDNSPSKGDTSLDISDDVDDVMDSGYTSSGSSVSSYPVSPSGSWSYQSTPRTRTHSLDSSSSITSTASSVSARAPVARKGVRPTRTCRITSKPTNYSRKFQRHTSKSRSAKEQCWKKIREVVIQIITELLPSDMRGNSEAAIADAYVQKMVKVANEGDSWSLISLNNNAGKNLELKFVENMSRQYEFSVDSFQIILDPYIGFKMITRDTAVDLNSDFYPSILAESVYGDFEGALRHLQHKRICTHRPEEIRGGGLLRYCNLLVRDFKPGEVKGFEVIDDNQDDISPTFGTNSDEDVERLEQLMCSRFFIDFNDFYRQQKKLSSYLENHFVNEDELKFNYLLTLRRVVDQNTICLMTHERSLIIGYITKLAREALAKNIEISAMNRPTPQPRWNPQTPVYYQQAYSQQQPMCFPIQQFSTTTSASCQQQINVVECDINNNQAYYNNSTLQCQEQVMYEATCTDSNSAQFQAINTVHIPTEPMPIEMAQSSVPPYTYTEPSNSVEVPTSNLQLVTSYTDTNMTYISQPTPVYSTCKIGYCQNCGTGQMFQAPDNNNNCYLDCNTNSNNNSNNSSSNFVAYPQQNPTCYYYPPQQQTIYSKNPYDSSNVMMMYPSGPELQIGAPNHAVCNQENGATNGAVPQTYPVIMCSETTQCFYGVSTSPTADATSLTANHTA